MAEGWKQVWEDIRNALRGEPGAEPEAPDERSTETDSPGIEAPTLSSGLDGDPTLAPSLQEPLIENALAGEQAALAEPAAPLVLRPERLADRVRVIAPYGIVALLLLGFAWVSGGNQLWLRWTAAKPPAPDVVATFEGGKITVADVEAHVKLLAPDQAQQALRSPETLFLVVEDMVIDELARRWAAQRRPDQSETFQHAMQHINESLNLESFDLRLHESDIPVTESEIQAYYEANKTRFGDQTLATVREQIRQTLVAQREQSYIQDYVRRLKDNASITTNLDLLNVPPPAEDDLRRYYDANRTSFQLPRQVVMDELRFPSRDEAAARQPADDALLKVRSGATFSEAGRAITGTLVLTGAIVSEGTRAPAWDAAVFALTQGEVSSVFRAGDSFYIVRQNELKPPRTQSLQEVRAQVMAVVQQQQTDEWFKSNADKTLLTLSGKQYTLGQFYQEYQELDTVTRAQYAGPEGMKRLTETLIERLLLVQDTYDKLLDTQNKPLSDESRLQVLKQMLHQEEIDDKIKITDEELQAYYNEHKAELAEPPQSRIRSITIRQGQTNDERTKAWDRANEAYKKLAPGLFQKGADFAEIARQYSEDESAAGAGSAERWIREEADLLAELAEHPFHQQILGLREGDISRPFEWNGVIYIVQVLERKPARPLSFDEAKTYIGEELRLRKHDALTVELSSKLLEQAQVKTYERSLQTWLAAQDQASPSAK